MIYLIFGIILLLATLIMFIMVGAAIKEGHVGTPTVLSILGLIFTYFSVVLIVAGLITHYKTIG